MNEKFIASNSWESYKTIFEEVDKFINELKVEKFSSALWDTLHNIIWHYRLDPVQWINDNTELVKQIASYKWISDIPENIRMEINLSIKKFRNKVD